MEHLQLERACGANVLRYVTVHDMVHYKLFLSLCWLIQVEAIQKAISIKKPNTCIHIDFYYSCWFNTVANCHTFRISR